jgi:hypothetical protein
MCGGDLAFEPGSTVCECEYCGSKQTIPSVDSEKKTNLFNRANRLRMNSEFDKASAVYEQIVAEFPEEAEAYWGLCLCAYGIEYVDDPATGSKIPTCHRTLPTSIMEDSNFEQACDYADPVARKVYREEAKTIDRIQKDILSIAQSETPYDVFICYKETAEDGSRTEDSVLAQDVYEALTAKGLKVFFSRITLEDKLGTQYEPYIYAALSSAKVMLAFGTTYEYYDAVWVKNEWSRFLGMMKADKRKVLIPCFKGLDAYDMPKEFRGLQAQDMAKLGWMQDLVRGVEKLCGKGETATTVVQKTVVQEVQESGKADNLMKRVYLYLEDWDFEKASEYIDKVLDVDAEYAPAYVAQILVARELTEEADLATLRASIDDDPTWKKALRFANEEQKQRYLGYAKQINENEVYDKEQKKKQAELAVKKEQYDRALAEISKGNYFWAMMILHQLNGYKDAEKLMRQCLDKYKEELLQKEQEQRKTLAEKEQEQKEEAKRAEELQTQIHRLNAEIDQLHGLFNIRKRQKLQEEVKELLDEQKQLAQRQYDIEQNLSAVRAKLKGIQPDEESQCSDEVIMRKVKKQWEVTQTGKCIVFGHYPQTKDGKDNTPIEWLILERDGLNALVVSKYGLDAQPYNISCTDVTWEKCTLRTWLNDTFYNKAFSADEQAAILTTNVDNSKSQCYSGWNTSGGNNTQDKVFLLSYAEANKYFGVEYWQNNGATDKVKSRVAPTAYAIAQGAGKTSSYKTVDGIDAGWWWLRSPGPYPDRAAYVLTDGSLHYSGVRGDSGSVRPALWVNIESKIF